VKVVSLSQREAIRQSRSSPPSPLQRPTRSLPRYGHVFSSLCRSSPIPDPRVRHKPRNRRRSTHQPPEVIESHVSFFLSSPLSSSSCESLFSSPRVRARAYGSHGSFLSDDHDFYRRWAASVRSFLSPSVSLNAFFFVYFSPPAPRVYFFRASFEVLLLCGLRSLGNKPQIPCACAGSGFSSSS